VNGHEDNTQPGVKKTKF